MTMNSMKKINSKTTKPDYILTILVIVLSIGSIVKLKATKQSEKKQAIIFINNKKMKEIDLAKNAVIKMKHSTFEIKNHTIRIVKTDCPKKICMHTGWISRAHESIVCIPNKIYIEIKERFPKKDYHVVSY